MVGLELSHQESNSSDVSGVARGIPPSEGGRDGTSLNFGSEIDVERSKHLGLGPHNTREVVRLNPVPEVFDLRTSRPDVGQDTSSRIERTKVNSNHGGPIVPAFKRRKLFL